MATLKAEWLAERNARVGAPPWPVAVANLRTPLAPGGAVRAAAQRARARACWPAPSCRSSASTRAGRRRRSRGARSRERARAAVASGARRSRRLPTSAPTRAAPATRRSDVDPAPAIRRRPRPAGRLDRLRRLLHRTPGAPHRRGAAGPAARRRPHAAGRERRLLRAHDAVGGHDRQGAPRGPRDRRRARAARLAAGLPIVFVEPSCQAMVCDDWRAAAARRRRRRRRGRRGALRRSALSPTPRRPAGCAFAPAEAPWSTPTATSAPCSASSDTLRALRCVPEPRAAGARRRLLRHVGRVRLSQGALRAQRAASPSGPCCRRCARPAPRSPLLATGTSCRSQIGDLADRPARHPLELLAERLLDLTSGLTTRPRGVRRGPPFCGGAPGARAHTLYAGSIGRRRSVEGGRGRRLRH